jgi:hypothetical protein
MLADAVGAMIDVIAPGRRAGFHVDRMVMLARRIGEHLVQSPPRVADASIEAGKLAAEFGSGAAILSTQGLWSPKARAAIADVLPAGIELSKRVRDLTHLLQQPHVDVTAARAKAASVLGGTEDLRARAYAFEDRQRAS